MTARGVARSDVFLDEADYGEFLRLFAEATTRFAWKVSAFCLMPNHYHLVLTAPLTQLSAGMHRLNGLYAQGFNKRYDRPGHLFQNRFDARLVEGDRHLQAVCRYVVDNPVRARLCRRGESWPWCGLGAI